MGLLSKADARGESPLPEIGVFVEKFRKENVSFHCIVLRAEMQAVCGMIKSVGEAAELGNGNCLVLLPLSVDREMAAHRLAKSLGAEILCTCEANSADAALAVIASCR